MSKLRTIDFRELQTISVLNTPEATSTWQPVEHSFARNAMASALYGANFGIMSESIEIADDLQTACGKFSLGSRDETGQDWATEVLWINDHKKQRGITFGIGERVFVCTNGCVFAEEILKAKRTPGVLQKIEAMAKQVAHNIHEAEQVNNRRRHLYAVSDLYTEDANDLVVRLAQTGVLPSSKILPVLQEFRTPSFEYNHNKTSVLGIQSAITHVMKGYNSISQNDRTHKLTECLDTVVDFA